jgi:hypothetical protein
MQNIWQCVTPEALRIQWHVPVMLVTGETDIYALRAKFAPPPQLPAALVNKELYTTVSFVLAMLDSIHQTLIHVMNARSVHCKPLQATLVGLEVHQIQSIVNAI